MTTFAPPNVLVFDSGVGGLSICQKLIAQFPEFQLHYVSDNAAFPYGDKSEEFLIERASQVIEQALHTIAADIIVIACNTASTVVLPTLREMLSIPVVGVVPAIKTAAAQTSTGVIGLLATPGTVARQYTKELINEFAADKTVISVGSSELVRLAEEYLYTGSTDITVIQSIIDEFDAHPAASELDTVVLGCTHFPLLTTQLSALRNQWAWVDSGTAIANRVYSLLQENPKNKSAETAVQRADKHNAWFTKPDSSTEKLSEFLEGHRFSSPKIMEINQGR